MTSLYLMLHKIMYPYKYMDQAQTHKTVHPELHQSATAHVIMVGTKAIQMM